MGTQRGSYRYDSLEEKVQVEEFERLYRQASTLLEIERDLWPGLGLVTGKKVLDIGCGSGIISRELSKQVYPAQVTGLDVSQVLLDKAKIVCATQQSLEDNVDFAQGSVYDLPFLDDSFDVVYARLLFQHLNEPLKALKNIFRVLKPGGTLCILDVDKGWSGTYPEPKTSSALDEAIIKKQLAQGGDPWVGRKLSSYLNASKFKQVKTTVTLVDSDQLGLQNFFGMLSLGKSYQEKKNEFTRLKEKVRPELQALIDSPYAWSGFGLFVVTGQK